MARLTTTNGVIQTTNGVLQSAVPTIEIDYFDDGDIAEYGGETSFFQTQTATVHDGSHALQGDSESDGSEAVLVSGQGDGLPNYPDQGDIWEWYTYLTDGGDVAVNRFGVQAVNNDPDGYRIQVNADVNEIEVAYQLNGSYTELQATPAPIANHLNEWLRCVVEWNTDGSMNAYLFDAAGYEIGRNTGASDTQWSDGGTGWGAFNGASKTGTMYFDSAELVNAIAPATIVDSFRDGDISEYGGSTLTFDAVTSPVRHGGYAVQASGSTTTTSISSTSGLPTYPSAGDTFRCWMRSEHSNGWPRIMFATQAAESNPDRYAVRQRYGQDEVSIAKVEGGSTTVLETAAFTASTATWYDYEVDWRVDGTIAVTVYDEAKSQVASVSTSDTTYSSGGIGFMAASGDLTDATSTFDYMRIP